MRTFIAIAVPDAVRDRLEVALASMPAGLRPTPPHQWHVTLAFLGDTQTTAVDLAAAMRPTWGPFEVLLGRPGRFGDRVLWLHVASRPQDRLRALADEVRVALRRIGERDDDRPLHPHLTVARAGRRPVRQRDERWLATTDIHCVWSVDEVQVVHSRLGAGPAQHEVAATVRL